MVTLPSPDVSADPSPIHDDIHILSWSTHGHRAREAKFGPCVGLVVDGRLCSKA